MKVTKLSCWSNLIKFPSKSFYFISDFNAAYKWSVLVWSKINQGSALYVGRRILLLFYFHFQEWQYFLLELLIVCGFYIWWRLLSRLVWMQANLVRVWNLTSLIVLTRFLLLLVVILFLSDKLEYKIRFCTAHTTYVMSHLQNFFSTSYGIFWRRMFHFTYLNICHSDRNLIIINNLSWRLVFNRLLNLLENWLRKKEFYNMEFRRVKYFTGLV